MTGIRRFLRLATAAAAAGVLLSAPISHAAGTMAMDKMVAGASSKADHEELAKHYESEAATARSTAQMHQRMAESYERGAGTGIGKGAGNNFQSLAKHCRSLAERYNAVADDYAALASGERELAKQM